MAIITQIIGIIVLVSVIGFGINYVLTNFTKKGKDND